MGDGGRVRASRILVFQSTVVAADRRRRPSRRCGRDRSATDGAPIKRTARRAFVSACGAPDDMKVTMKMSVKMGHAADVTAQTYPPNPVVESCLERKARELQWDISPKTDHVTVTY